MALLKEDLQQLKVNEKEHDLVDMEHFIIDASKPVEERAEHFFNTVKNPYHFMINKFKVSISFNQTDITLDDKLKNYLSIVNKD